MPVLPIFVLSGYSGGLWRGYVPAIPEDIAGPPGLATVLCSWVGCLPTLVAADLLRPGVHLGLESRHVLRVEAVGGEERVRQAVHRDEGFGEP